EAELETALIYKRINILEASCQMQVPGKTKQEKYDWLVKRSPRELDEVTNYIRMITCNLSDRTPKLLQRYHDVSSVNKLPLAREVKSFEDWKVATEIENSFIMQRPFQDFLIEFPLKSLSYEIRMQIDKETKEPEPPRIPARNKETGRFDPSQTVP